MVYCLEQTPKYSKSRVFPLTLSEWLTSISPNSYNAPDKSNVLGSGGHLE